MKKRLVISANNLPQKLPVSLTWLSALSQSTWDIPGWGLGVLWTFVALIWILVIVDVFNCERRDVFKAPERKSN